MTSARLYRCQLAATLGLLAALALMPPAQGRMLLVPVWPGSDTRLASLAIDRGARLIATGPVAGSLVVDGERARLAPLLARGVLPLAAVALDCGGWV